VTRVELRVLEEERSGLVGSTTENANTLLHGNIALNDNTSAKYCTCSIFDI
jgi:hypothetical protein